MDNIQQYNVRLGLGIALSATIVGIVFLLAIIFVPDDAFVFIDNVHFKIILSFFGISLISFLGFSIFRLFYVPISQRMILTSFLGCFAFSCLMVLGSFSYSLSISIYYDDVPIKASLVKAGKELDIFPILIYFGVLCLSFTFLYIWNNLQEKKFEFDQT